MSEFRSLLKVPTPCKILFVGKDGHVLPPAFNARGIEQVWPFPAMPLTTSEDTVEIALQQDNAFLIEENTAMAMELAMPPSQSASTRAPSFSCSSHVANRQHERRRLQIEMLQFWHSSDLHSHSFLALAPPSP